MNQTYFWLNDPQFERAGKLLVGDCRVVASMVHVRCADFIISV